jgi:O-antigen/teichoic acid export membrane protein
MLQPDRWRKLWGDVARLRPHDVSLPEGREAERHRRVFLSALGAASSKGLAFLNFLAAVPLTVPYLGSERYGLWMTITGLIGFFSFADFGIGAGLMTSVARATGAGDSQGARRLISTAFLALTAIAAALGVTLLAVAPFVPWARVYNVESSQAVTEAMPATVVFVVCNLVGIPLSVAEGTRSAYQSAYTHNLWGGLGSLLALAALFLTATHHAGLTWLVLALSGGRLLGMLGSFVSLFYFEHAELRPSMGWVGGSAPQELKSMGTLFVVLNVTGFLLSSSDNFVLTQFLGPDAVARYSVTARLFSVIPLALAMLTTPLWPAYGEAIARGDSAWVRKTVRRSMILVAVMSCAGSAVLLLASKQIVAVWAGTALVPSIDLLVSLALWTVIQAWGHALAMLLNAALVVRFQIIVATVTTVAALLMKIVIVNRWGISGVVWANTIAYVPLTAIPTLILVPRLLGQISLRDAGARGAESEAYPQGTQV